MKQFNEYADVQGLVRFGYGRLTHACFLLLKIEDPAAARTWLGKTEFNNAVDRGRAPDKALHVAFSCGGLRALGASEEILNAFSPEFISGMAGEESRSRRLGDVSSNAPSQWEWGSPTAVPDLLLLLYCLPEQYPRQRQELVDALPSFGLQLLHTPLETVNHDDREPFGFRDGVSQMEIDWDQQRKLDSSDQLDYTNLVALGEVLLGYRNEYGKITDRPLIPPHQDELSILLPAEDHPGKHDFGRNGTYLVFRHLQQDVRGFWQYLDKQANSDPRMRKKLAEAMVGRTLDGEPLAPKSSFPLQGVGPDPDDIRLNQFTYESDKAGSHVPLGAHIRRTNPRNADLPYGTKGWLSHLIRILGFGQSGLRDDLVASTRFHRLLRRGRRFGPVLLPDDAVQPSEAEAEPAYGLHFICLCANISRQFEFVQNAWATSPKFDGLSEEGDPLLGNREPYVGCPVTDSFSLSQDNGLRRRLQGLPNFVSVRGGAYFFMPSIGGLRYLTMVPGSPPNS